MIILYMNVRWTICIVLTTGVKKAETARRGVLLNHDHACSYSTYMLHDIAHKTQKAGS